MKKILLFLFIFILIKTYSQDYQISFKGTGASTTVDSVMVITGNETNYSILSINGSDILHLVQSVGNDSLKEIKYTIGDTLIIFGFSGLNYTRICLVPIQSQTVTFNFVVCSDGDNNYGVVQIGTQSWMDHNLQTVKYNNGDSIPIVKDNSAWYYLTTGANCIYNNWANASWFDGRLYNRYAVIDIRGLCPIGWHVPTYSDWQILQNYLGGWASAGGKMKDSPYGFSGYLSGERMSWSGEYTMHYWEYGETGRWWSSSTDNYAIALYKNSTVFGYNYYTPANFGLSVRCLADMNSDNINENNKINNSYNIYPNPASNFIIVNINDFRINQIKAEIYDILGKSVYNENIKPANNRINVSNLNDGIYFLKLSGKDFHTSEKIIISHK